jgi:hypothetical protein
VLSGVRFLAFFCGLVLCYSANAIELNRSNQSGVAEAYGFVIGQQITLDRIAERYPELAREALLARLAFERTFGDVPDKIDPMLKNTLGSDEYEKFRADLTRQLKSQLNSDPLTKPIAEGFFDEVRGRADGDIYSPTLEYLLAIRFGDWPVEEYTKGFRQKYQTDGSGKSRGIVLHMQLPRSWEGMEGNRPHIVRKWKSEAGTGMGLIMLQVRKTQGVHITRADVAEMMQPGEVADLVPDGGVLKDYGMVSMENLPGYFTDFSILQERAGMAIFQKLRQYTFFYADRMVSIQCSAVGLERQHEAVDKSFESVKPLCIQVFNSVVIPDKYLAPEVNETESQAPKGI